MVIIGNNIVLDLHFYPNKVVDVTRIIQLSARVKYEI